MTAFQKYLSKDFVRWGNLIRLDNADAAWNTIDKRMRTAIRKARTYPIEIRRIKGTEKELELFSVICLNRQELPRVLTDQHHMWWAFVNGEFCAGIIVIELGDRLFMHFHASNNLAKQHNIPSLLIWHVVEQFTGSRFQWLDVGASYRESLQNYFLGWRTATYPTIWRPPDIIPTIELTPFDTRWLAHKRDPAYSVDEDFKTRFVGKPYTFFPRAQYAIFSLVRWLFLEGRLSADDEVYITTTTDSPYVSRCVTAAIEQTCRWGRELNEKTKAIFVIHEFGFPCLRVAELRRVAYERGIPLIEDCAYAWGTHGVGEHGDFSIWSFTKAFPMQYGGLLVGQSFPFEYMWKNFQCADAAKEVLVRDALSWHLQYEARYREARKRNWNTMEGYFGASRSFFKLTDAVSPAAYVLRIESEERMKEMYNFIVRFGIHAARYWTNSALILPIHQSLETDHLAYIAGTVNACYREWCGVPEWPPGAAPH